MELGDRRVLIGFEESRVAARLEGELLVIDDAVSTQVASAVRIPSAYSADQGDVVTEIQRHKTDDPVLPGAVSASNIADAELDPALVFDPASPPLDAPRGGTGLSAVPAGALVLGGGTGPATVTAQVSFADGSLTAPSLTLGTWRLAASNDDLGRRSVFATDAATGCNVDLLLAGKHVVSPPALSVSPGQGGQVTVEASTPDPLVRLIHFDWRPSPSPDRTPAQVARAPSKSVVVSPDGTARFTATGLTPASTYDFRVAAEDGRGNVSEVVAASGAAAS